MIAALYTELRRLKDLELWVQNQILRMEITIAEHSRLKGIESENPEPSNNGHTKLYQALNWTLENVSGEFTTGEFRERVQNKFPQHSNNSQSINVWLGDQTANGRLQRRAKGVFIKQ